MFRSVYEVNLRLTDKYVVKFWIKKSDGYYEQRCESVYLDGKDKHKQAQRIVELRFVVPIEVISVVYQ